MSLTDSLSVGATMLKTTLACKYWTNQNLYDWHDAAEQKQKQKEEKQNDKEIQEKALSTYNICFTASLTDKAAKFG